MRGEVPDGAHFPYTTYDLIRPPALTSSLQTVLVWTKPSGGGLKEYLNICAKIEELIPETGTMLRLPDGSGAISLRRGTPFIQSFPQEEKSIKAAYVNVEIRTLFV